MANLFLLYLICVPNKLQLSKSRWAFQSFPYLDQSLLSLQSAWLCRHWNMNTHKTSLHYWFLLPLTFSSHTSTLSPSQESEFEGLFIFTLLVYAYTKALHDSLWIALPPAAGITKMVMWCAWDCFKVVKKIKAQAWIWTWAAAHCCWSRVGSI